MLLDIDLLIFSLFLSVNLVVGLYYSQGVKTIKDYSIGQGNFSTATIVATVVASWIGAGFFTYTLTETYRNGFYFFLPSLADSLLLTLMGYVFIPRMSEFLGKLSIAEAMGDLFGRHVKLVTIICSIISSVGILGVQFKVAANILRIVFDTSGNAATIISALIVILYSAFGGIRAVTFTDVIQFFTFGCIIPVIGSIIWNAINDHTIVNNLLNNSENFDLKKVFDISSSNFYEMLIIFIFFLVPCFSPMLFQRISMASNIRQASKAFKIAGILALMIQILIGCIGILILADNPNIDPDNLMNYITNHYNYPGFKGIIAVGLMSMIMSTSDSLLNSMSVIFAHDLCKPLGFKWSNNELLVSKIFSVVIGICAIFVALRLDSVLTLIKQAFTFYAPIVSIPFVFAVFGFRSSPKVVLIGMCAAAVTVCVAINMPSYNIDPFIAGIVSNTIFLFSSHYILKEPGGWVGIKNPQTLEIYKQEQRKWLQDFLNQIVSFNFAAFCRKSFPNNHVIVSYLGFFTMVSVILSIYTLPKPIYNIFPQLINFIFISAMIISCYFATYPIIWPVSFLNHSLVHIIWVIGVWCILVIYPIILALINNLSETQLMMFFSNMLVLSIIFRWQAVILMIASGMLVAVVLFKSYTGIEELSMVATDLEFKILYSLLLFSGILIAFLKPLQQDSEKQFKLFTETQEQMKEMSEQIINLLIMKQEFINNINHDIRIPIHNIGSSIYLLRYDWDKLLEEEKRENISIIYQGYKNISSYMNNILDLSDLSNNKMPLTYTKINFITLTEKIIQSCKDLYLKDPDNIQLIITNYTQNASVLCDEKKISQVIKHLIKNAIEYTNNGVIEVILSNETFNSDRGKNLQGLKFSVVDEGIGVPENEVLHIFGPFIKSSYTKKKTRNAGIGLALAEKIIKIHQGIIWVSNNIDKKGATFSFIIPIR